MRERWRSVWKPVLTGLSWLAFGGWAMIVAAFGAIVHWPLPGVVMLFAGSFMVLLTRALAFRKKALAEQLGQPGVSTGLMVLGASVTATKGSGDSTIMEIQFDVRNQETKEIPTPRPVGVVRLLEPRRENRLVRKFPERFRLGRIALIWPQYLVVKELNDRGMVVEGIRSTGVNIRMETYFTQSV
jgi:hypothetical protein